MNLVSFRRKLFYIAAIILIAVPLYVLGQPETKNSGGTLAKMRNRYDFGQSDLGDLDPASEAAQLGTLGLRGIASTILWNQAEGYRRDQKWDQFSATLNQIAKIQPHFVNVWEHQAHNLSYNISAEFDDYTQRFEWVKKGIAFLVRGTEFNRRQPILEWYLGLYNGSKIGKADEKVQYRDLFRGDEDFHDYLAEQGLDSRQADALGPDNLPDNWLVGRLWYEKSYALVADGAYCKKTRHIYYSDSPKCYMNHGISIETEGVIDDRAKYAWNRGSVAWRDFGEREVVTTRGNTISLNSEERVKANIERLKQEFDEVTGDARDRVIEELVSKLDPRELEIYNKPVEQQTRDEQMVGLNINSRVRPTYLQIADKAEGDKSEAMRLAVALEREEMVEEDLRIYRENVNYGYWETRSIAEQNDYTLAARQQIYAADQAIEEAAVDQALELYEMAWRNWYLVFSRFPILMTDQAGDEVAEGIRRYKRILDAPFTDDFPLKDFVEFREMQNTGGYEYQTSQIMNEMQEKAKTMTDDDLKVMFEDMTRQDNEPAAEENQAESDAPAEMPEEENVANESPDGEPTTEEPMTEEAESGATAPEQKESQEDPPKEESAKEDTPKADSVETTDEKADGPPKGNETPEPTSEKPSDDPANDKPVDPKNEEPAPPESTEPSQGEPPTEDPPKEDPPKSEPSSGGE